MMEKPVYRLAQTQYASDELIPEAGESIGWRLSFIDAIRGRPSLMFRSAVQSTDAAVTLLAVRQISQAYLLLFQAAEVSLKGLLDEIQRAGVAAWAAKNPRLFRNRALGNDCFDEVTLRETVQEKTFIRAFREVSAIINFSDVVKTGHTSANRTRNEIIHRGGEQDRTHVYLDGMLTVLFPLLDEFYSRAFGLDLADLLLHDVARELIVASRYLRETSNPAKKWSIAISTVHFAYFHRRSIEHGAPSDFDPYGYGWNDRGDLNYEWERECIGRLRDNPLEDEWTTCRICGERCFLATDGKLLEKNNRRFFAVSHLICAHCHLEIDDPLLARLHYGTIDRELLGHEVWINLLNDFGYTNEAKQDDNP